MRTIKKHKKNKIIKKSSKRTKLKGGSVRYNNHFIGLNSTGRKDAELLNYLRIKWNGIPGTDIINIIDFYKNPDKRITHFNHSLLSSIDDRQIQPNITYIIDLINDIIETRKIDAYRHYDIYTAHDPGHAYIYAVMRWLHSFMIEVYIDKIHNTTLLKDRDRLIDVYKQEFMNLFQQEYEEYTRRVTAYHSVNGQLIANSFVTHPIIDGNR